MIVECSVCMKRCQSGKASSWWYGSERKYRCVACTRRMLRRAEVMTLNSATAEIVKEPRARSARSV